MSIDQTIRDACAKARELGEEDARQAASWVADGNVDPEHVRRVLEMLEDGDPAVEQYLPARPDLSGQWADSMSPRDLFEATTGLDAHAESTWCPDAYNDVVTALCDSYEDGVSETFESACEAELRHWLPCYSVTRFTFKDEHPDNHRVIKRGLTLEEAQAHCQREDTHGEDAERGPWFDGYREEATS